MIAKIVGKLVEKRPQSVIVNVQELFYEVMVPAAVLHRIDESENGKGDVQLITYHYFQLTQSSAVPMLIGFTNDIELDFFKNFIKVSGIGPKAAVKALNKPISEIVQAIDTGDYKYLKTLPGIGERKAKEIIAKLQGRVGKFGLIQDQIVPGEGPQETSNLKEEALSVLMQLQYKKTEALNMIDKALKHGPNIRTSEELLSEIYKQKVKI